MGYNAEIKALHKPGKGGIIEVGTDFLEAYFDVSRPTLAQWTGNLIVSHKVVAE